MTIFTGFFGQPNPTPLSVQTILEPPEGGPEPDIVFTTGGLYFDIVDPNPADPNNPISD